MLRDMKIHATFHVIEQNAKRDFWNHFVL